MQTGKYPLLDILDFTNLEQFIIPELQRDYVWKKSDVKDILSSLDEAFDNDTNEKPYLGFIYAYNDKDYAFKYFLVDGQQRMTTIFLLFVACYHKLRKHLPDYILKNNKLKIDYKVRQITHDFLISFVNHCEEYPEAYEFDICNQVWFHNEYSYDKTIMNIVNNYNFIRSWLNKYSDEQISKFVKFIEDKVELSYFDIENGRQGEDIYIYLNSRGLNLEPNETFKAKYLSKIEDFAQKQEWGKKWELWQDFFWKHRGNNSIDADEGFNEFLLQIQIINLCRLSKPLNEITESINSTTPNFNYLPQSLEEVEKYFQAFEWLVNSKKVNIFFKKYERSNFLTSNSYRSQIYYFRLLPIIALIANIKVKNEDAIIRFIRFIYNISRKSSSIGKDISNQLPVAIKLMIEYGNSKTENYDVCDLIDYQKGRTVIINDEELMKLSIFKNPPTESSREEIENMFWNIEDHKVFEGEIIFLLNRYYDKVTNNLKLERLKQIWLVFQTLFNGTKENNALITRALLFYGFTWNRRTPFYYYNYNCQDWSWLINNEAGNYLYHLLEDIDSAQPINSINRIIEKKIFDYFKVNNFDSVQKLKIANDRIEQIRILAAIDFYNEKILWKQYSNIAFDDRYSYEGDKAFFVTNRVIFNVFKYIRDGQEGRIIRMMSNILQNEEKLNELINRINQNN